MAKPAATATPVSCMCWRGRWRISSRFPLLHADLGDLDQGQPLEPAFGPHELLHERIGGGSEDLLGGCVLLEDAADVQDGDAVRHLDRLVDVVGNEDDGLLESMLDVEEL